MYGTTANRRPPLSGPPLSGPFCKYRRFMTRDYPPHGSESPGVFIPILGFSPHRGVTNRGARVDAAHARARERTTRDTGEDGPRDELSRVESSRVESSRRAESLARDDERGRGARRKKRISTSIRKLTRWWTKGRDPCEGGRRTPACTRGTPRRIRATRGGGGARHGARFTANEGGSR